MQSGKETIKKRLRNILLMCIFLIILCIPIMWYSLILALPVFIISIYITIQIMVLYPPNSEQKDPFDTSDMD